RRTTLSARRPGMTGSGGSVAQELPRGNSREGSLASKGKVLPLNELHGQNGPAVGQGPEVVDGGDPGVLQLPGDARLVREPGGRGGVRAEPLLEQLDGDLAAEDGVCGPVDSAHAAAGDLVEDLVTARVGRAGRTPGRTPR